MQVENDALLSAHSKMPILRGNRAVLALKSAPLPVNKFQELVRTRLRERTPNFTVLARFLKTDPSTIQKRLREDGTALCLDWLDSVTAFYQMSVAEMCALPGAAWQEVKPLEAQLLAIFRDMTELEKRSLIDVLDRQAHARPSRRPRAGHAELTEEQQLLVDLYARSEMSSREGVLKILRGAARKAAQDNRDRRDTHE